MEVESCEQLPENTSVISGHKVRQTREAKWLCLDDIYQKLHRPHLYDIGGTYSQDVADYWFIFKTEQVSNVHLLHIFVCNRQECSEFSVSISQSTDMKFGDKNGVIYFSQCLKERTFKNCKEMSQNYLSTYSFNTFDLGLLKNKKLYIAVSFTPEMNIQQTLTDHAIVTHDFGALLENPVGSDFVIESADGAKFQVHKILLRAHSEVFKAMLKEETAESQNGCVKLINVGKEDLQIILEYIYTGKIKDLENCNWFNMLMLGDRYNIKGLREISQYALNQQLTTDNAVEIFMVADMYNSDVLKSTALKFIKKNASLIPSSTFREVNNPHVMSQLFEYLIHN